VRLGRLGVTVSGRDEIRVHMFLELERTLRRSKIATKYGGCFQERFTLDNHFQGIK